MGTSLKKGQQISQFKIVEILPEGSGGMANVVKAQHNKTGSFLALKICRSSDFGNFSVNALKAEVEILRRLSHPGIVKIIPIESEIGKTVYMERATEVTGAPWFFAMEYLAGGSVGDLLKKIKNLTEGETGAIIFHVMRALDYIHHQGYSHNDIKMNNVLFRNLLEKNGQFEPVLIDFGITRKKERIQQDAGSLQYMAPEQLAEIRQERPPELAIDGTKVDVYAIGVLMYRMLAQKLPLNGISEVGITTAIMTKTPVEPNQINSQISPQVNELIMACLAKRPENRPTSKQIMLTLHQYADCRFTSYQSGGLFKKTYFAQ